MKWIRRLMGRGGSHIQKYLFKANKLNEGQINFHALVHLLLFPKMLCVSVGVCVCLWVCVWVWLC